MDSLSQGKRKYDKKVKRHGISFDEETYVVHRTQGKADTWECNPYVLVAYEVAQSLSSSVTEKKNHYGRHQLQNQGQIR